MLDSPNANKKNMQLKEANKRIKWEEIQQYLFSVFLVCVIFP